MKFKKFLILVVLIIFAMPTLWILYFMFIGSFMSQDEIIFTIAPALFNTEGITNFSVLPSYPTIESLVKLLIDTPVFYVMYNNSLIYSSLSIIISLVFASPCSWALSRYNFKFKNVFSYLYIILMLLPFQVTMVPTYITLNNFELINTIWSIILPFAFSAFPVFIMRKSFDNIPLELIEAARIDGATEFKIFLLFGIPLGHSGILASIVLMFIEIFSSIDQPLVFLTDKTLYPISLYFGELNLESLEIAIPASLIIMTPIIIIFLSSQNYFESGIQTAGLKG